MKRDPATRLLVFGPANHLDYAPRDHVAAVGEGACFRDELYGQQHEGRHHAEHEERSSSSQVRFSFSLTVPISRA